MAWRKIAESATHLLVAQFPAQPSLIRVSAEWIIALSAIRLQACNAHCVTKLYRASVHFWCFIIIISSRATMWAYPVSFPGPDFGQLPGRCLENRDVKVTGPLVHLQLRRSKAVGSRPNLVITYIF